MLQAQGNYRSGCGGASKYLPLQIPGIAPGFPEIRNFYPATINVRFEPKIIVAGFDHRTPPLRWAEGLAEGEVFDLVRVKLAFPDLETRVGALLYVAHWSALRIDPHTHEFVAERFVDGLRIDMPVIMECDRNAVELPYESHVRASNGDLYLARTFVIL